MYTNPCVLCTGLVPKWPIGISASGWGQITGDLESLKAGLGGPPDPIRVNTLLAYVEKDLQRLSYDVARVIAQRRTFLAGRLEVFVRALEEDAQSRLARAASHYHQSRAYSERGDLKSAVLACDAALTSVTLGCAALDTQRSGCSNAVVGGPRAVVSHLLSRLS